MKTFLSILIVVCLLIVGCAPPAFIPKEMPIVKFEPTPPYQVDLSTIPKPAKPVHIWMDENFKETSIDKAKYLILTKPEYAKYVSQLQIKGTYKEIVEQQQILINQYIDVINSLKEYVALEQAKAEAYRQLWADSENAYRYERHLHNVDNAIAKGGFTVISVGALVMAILIAL